MRLLLLTVLTCLALAAQEPPAPAGTEPRQPVQKNWGRYFNTVDRGAWRPLTGEERWRIYWRATYASPGTFFRAAGPALGDHLNGRPEVWPQGIGGYSRRLANRFARFALQDSMSHAGAAALGYEVRYVRCGCQGFFPRFGHALLWNFLTLDRRGATVVNTPRIGSAFAAEFIGNSWMPEGYRTNAEAFRGVGVQLGLGALFNTIREFAPRGKAGGR
ncbi:MAG: hypothetical protein ACOYX1_00545 [Acidobacteriota bacterium]